MKQKIVIAALVAFAVLALLYKANSDKKVQLQIQEMQRPQSNNVQNGVQGAPVSNNANLDAQKDLRVEADTAKDQAQETAKGLKSSIEQNARLRKLSLSEQEVKSVKSLSELMMKATFSRLSSEQLGEKLKDLGLELRVSQENSQVLGRQVRLQGAKSLEGTRHFITEMSQSKDGKMFVNLMAFEVRPGLNSYEVAESVIRQVLPAGYKVNTNRKKLQTGGLVSLYDLTGGYQVMIHQRSKQELQSTPVHAVDKELDQESVRIVIGENIEEGL